MKLGPILPLSVTHKRPMSVGYSIFPIPNHAWAPMHELNTEYKSWDFHLCYQSNLLSMYFKYKLGYICISIFCLSSCMAIYDIVNMTFVFLQHLIALNPWMRWWWGTRHRQYHFVEHVEKYTSKKHKVRRVFHLIYKTSATQSWNIYLGKGLNLSVQIDIFDVVISV